MPCQTTAHHSPISSPNTWRDLGRSDEVAGGANRAGPRPIAVHGIGEAQSHEALDRHGAVAADALAQDREQRRAAVVSRSGGH